MTTYLPAPMTTYLMVCLDNDRYRESKYGRVSLYANGEISVNLRYITVYRRDLSGYVHFSADGTVISSTIEDAYSWYQKPSPRVQQAAVNAAWKQAKYARRVARQIANAKGPVYRYEPGTLQHLVALAEGKIREDGWPKGHIPL
jgi:hypothetical protein